VEDPTEQGHSKDTIVAEALETIRNFLLCRKSKLGVTRSYFQHIRNKHPELGCPEQPVVVWRNGFYDWRRQKGVAIGRKNYWGLAAAERFTGWDAIWQMASSTWWEWTAGSAPFYWRWPEEYQTTIRDGLEI
jgi:hypothetical protein